MKAMLLQNKTSKNHFTQKTTNFTKKCFLEGL
eukprot:CAMPEP_0202427360 /NCGR_PEP_ID=MMETSP1345-20130828/1605_1 /ASSEMBLY_ACC=CAM_ASM_000843 /TAXON_ID=342563 /ORGANISM="Fabrea Fabrea salina" /LENGTH=31 /DNA_ID= /DNA_START= /DNA_END= /DNA_ORIENTATION=